MSIEEQQALYDLGMSPAEIRKQARYKISKKDYLAMLKKRNAQGDQSVCKCGHDINHHAPSKNILKYPAGPCMKVNLRRGRTFCRCKRYVEKEIEK